MRPNPLILILCVAVCGSAIAQQAAMVSVLVDDQPAGAGVVIEVDQSQPVADGWVGKIATAAHVVEGADSIRIVYRDGRRAKECRVIEVDQERDLAVVLVWVPRDIVPVRVAKKAVRAGERLRFYCADAVREVLASDPTDDRWVFSDLTLRAGDSGGPVFNEAGELVGVVSGGWFWYGDPVPKRKTWPARASNVTVLQLPTVGEPTPAKR